MRNGCDILFFLGWSVVFAAMLAMISIVQRKAGDPAPTSLSEADVQKIDSVEILKGMHPDGRADERIVVSRSGGRWRMETPVSAEADESAVKRLIDTAVFSEPVDFLPPGDMARMGRSLRDFGLNTPRFMLSMTSGGVRETYSFGSLTPSGDEVYAAKAGGEEGIFTVSSRIVAELARPVGEWRRRRLFSFELSDVAGIGMKNAGEALSKVTRSGGTWRLTEPVEAPADRAAADEIAAALCSARVIDYATAGAGSGLGPDEGYAVSLRDAFGNIEKAVFGAAAGDGAAWVLTPEGAVARIDASLKKLCVECRHRLEDTRVFPVDAKDVVSLSVSEGFPAYVVSRAADPSPWRLVSPVDSPADAALTGKLLARVLALRNADLASGESAGCVSVSVGTAGTNFPSHKVSADFVLQGTRLPDLHGKTLVKYPRAKVKRIRVTTAAGAAWDASRSESVVALVEAGVTAGAIETVVPRTADFERCGFSRPSYTFTFELDDKASSMRKMLLGAAAPGGGRYATAGGSDAVFILSAAAVSTLTKPVEETMEEKK